MPVVLLNQHGEAVFEHWPGSVCVKMQQFVLIKRILLSCSSFTYIAFDLDWVLLLLQLYFNPKVQCHEVVISWK